MSLPSTRQRTALSCLSCGLACVLSSSSCTSVLGLDVVYEDPAAGGGPTTSSTSTSAPSSAESGATVAGSTSTSPSSSASTSTAGGGGDGGGGAGPGGGGGNGGNGGNGGACTEANLVSDDFEVDGEPDEVWTPLQDAPGLLPSGYEVIDGALTFGSEGGESQWYRDGPGGPFIYQTVEGEFFAWTRAHATLDDGVTPPGETYHGVGLLLREPQPTPGTTETFIMAVVGVGGVSDECVIGASVTRGGVAPPVPTELAGVRPCSADLAICRSGGVTHVYGRNTAGDPWEPVPIESLDENPDDVFADELQIGPAVYSYQGTEETRGTFDQVIFESTCGRSCQEILDDIQGQ